MRRVSAEFSNNADSVAAAASKADVYNRQIDEQRKKIDMIKAALGNAAKEYGANSNQVKDWQIKLNNAEAQLKQTENALEKLGDEAKDSGIKFENFGGVLKGVGVALGAVAVAAGAAAVAIGKQVISAYADYEQLVGGVDTLFKSSSQAVQDYAANAFKTAGMTANEYMKTVTGFSASLIQSLGGDTVKAAELADQAITDMSDNANKMGTGISSIQNAYQGFAKQNYTMLDNLKLGYGGTKVEMERLLADAEKISGYKFDISSFADVTQAIHIMQVEMGIAGTTAKEATETISGSIAGMQSAIGNLIAGLGDANADIVMLVENVAEAFQNVMKNITPVVENVIAALPVAIGAVIHAAAELLPTLLDTVTDLFSQVLTTIITLLPGLIPAATEAVMTIVDTLVDNLPLLIDAALQMVTTLANGIAVALPELTPAIVGAVLQVVQVIVDNLPMLLDAGLAIIEALGTGIIESLPDLVAKLPAIIIKIAQFVTDAIPEVGKLGVKLLKALWSANKDIEADMKAAIADFKVEFEKQWNAQWSSWESFGETMGKAILQGLLNTPLGIVIELISKMFGVELPESTFTKRYQADKKENEQKQSNQDSPNGFDPSAYGDVPVDLSAKDKNNASSTIDAIKEIGTAATDNSATIANAITQANINADDTTQEATKKILDKIEENTRKAELIAEATKETERILARNSLANWDPKTQSYIKSGGGYIDWGKGKITEIIASYASGTDYVPRTGLYQLHQGEKVIPAEQTAPIGGTTINLNVDISKIKDVDDLIRIAKSAKQSLRMGVV